MSEVTIYVVEDGDGNTVAFDSGTFSYAEAKEIAQRMKGVVIAREFEYSGSYIEFDFTEDHLTAATLDE